MALKLEIITPDRVVQSCEAAYVSLPGVEGEFGVLPGHVPLVAALKVGCMHYTRDGKNIHASIGGGFAEIADDRVAVLVDSAELASEVNVSRAEAALKRARDRLTAGRGDDVNVIRAEAALQRAISRLQATKL
ncbi:ATP synthase epsilon chain [Deltaproteobacteria bacterium]|nr:ATP synthase epsilon chain [Deltaproteobacteria bacterium]